MSEIVIFEKSWPKVPQHSGWRQMGTKVGQLLPIDMNPLLRALGGGGVREVMRDGQGRDFYSGAWRGMGRGNTPANQTPALLYQPITISTREGHSLVA